MIRGQDPGDYVPNQILALGFSYGLTAAETRQIVSSSGAGSEAAMANALRRSLFREIGMPTGTYGDEDMPMTPLMWRQMSESGRAQARSMQPLGPGYRPETAMESGAMEAFDRMSPARYLSLFGTAKPSSWASARQSFMRYAGWQPGSVSRPGRATQFGVEQTFGATPWPVQGGNLYTGLSDPSKLVKRASQMIFPYQRVSLTDVPETQAPWRTGPSANVPETGHVLRTAVLFGDALPEGISYIDPSVGMAQDRHRKKFKVPAGFTPQLVPTGTEWSRGQRVSLFPGAAPVSMGDWERMKLLGATFQPGTEGKQGTVSALFQRQLPVTRGLALSSWFSKSQLVGANVEQFLGEPGFQMATSGGVRDVYGLAFSAYSAMSNEQFKALTGRDRPETWQAGARALTDIFTGQIAPQQARMFNLPNQILSEQSFAAMQQAGRVASYEQLGSQRYRATLQFPGLDVNLFSMFTRAGTYEHRTPFVAEHTLRRMQELSPEMYQQFMEEGRGPRRWRQETMQAYMATRGMGYAPSRFTAAADVPWASVMTDALQRAMKISGAQTEADIPTAAYTSALLQRVPLRTGALQFESRGRQYYFPHPTQIPAVPGGVQFEEISSYRRNYARLIAEHARFRDIGAEAEPGYRSALARTVLASHRLVSSREFTRRMTGAEPRSLYGGMAAASFANMPEEVYLPTRIAAQASGVRPGTARYGRFAKWWEGGGAAMPVRMWREPTTTGEATQITAFARSTGIHPQEELRSSQVPIMSPELGQAGFGDFDKDDYMIARERGVPLAQARAMKLQMRSNILAMTSKGMGASAAAGQAKGIGEFPTTESMLDWLQGARASETLGGVREMYQRRGIIGKEMGLGFNIQEQMMAAAPGRAAKSAAEALGSRMYAEAQKYTEWSPEIQRMVELFSANVATGGSFNPIASEGRFNPFGASSTGLMAHSIMAASQLPLTARQQAAMLTPAGATKLRGDVAKALSRGAVGAAGAFLEEAMTPGQFGEQTLMGRMILGRASSLAERKGQTGISPRLTEIGEQLRGMAAFRSHTAMPLSTRLEYARMRRQLQGEPPAPFMQGYMGPPGTVASEVAAMSPQEADQYAIQQASQMFERERTARSTTSTAELVQNLRSKLGSPSGGSGGGGRIGGRLARWVGGTGNLGGGGNAGLPPAAPPAAAPVSPGPGDGDGGGGRREPMIGRVVFPGPSGSDLDTATRNLGKWLGEWAEAVKPALEGTRDLTKNEQEMTKRLLSWRNTIDKAMYARETGAAQYGVKPILDAIGVRGQPGMASLTGAEDMITDAYMRQRMPAAPPSSIRGRMGAALTGLGQSGFAGGLQGIFSGWEMMRLRRMWQTTGGTVFQQQIPAAAQADIAAFQAGNVILGATPGAQFPGVAGGLLAFQAQQQESVIAAGRAGYQTWGAGMLGNIMGGARRAQAVVGPAAGAGLLGGWGLTQLGTMAGLSGAAAAGFGLVGGLGIAGGLGAYATAQYMMTGATPTPENQLRAAGLMTDVQAGEYQDSGWLGQRIKDLQLGFRSARGIGGALLSGDLGISRGEFLGTYFGSPIGGIDLAQQIAQRGAEWTAQQAQAGQRYREVPFGQLGMGARGPALTDLADQLRKQGGAFGAYDSAQIVQMLQQVGPFIPGFESMTTGQIAGMPPDLLRIAAQTGQTPDQYLTLAKQLNMGPMGAADITRRMAYLSGSERMYAEQALGQYGWMRGFGVSGDQLLNAATATERTTLRGARPGDLGMMTPGTGVTGFEFQPMARLSGLQQTMGQQMAGVTENLRLMGVGGLPAPEEIIGMSPADIEQMYQRMSGWGRQAQLGQQLMGMGLSPAIAGRTVTAMQPYGIQGMQALQGFLGGDQWTMSMLGAGNISQMAGGGGMVQLPGGLALDTERMKDAIVAGMKEFVPPDYFDNIQEMIGDLRPLIEPETGLRMGTTQMWRGFGQEYLAGMPAGYLGRVGVSNQLWQQYTTIGEEQGVRGLEAQQRMLQTGYRQFQFQQQERGLALREVSQFGGSFTSPYGRGTLETRGSFAIQEELRNLSRVFEDFSSNFQEQQRALGYRQYMENWQVRSQRLPVQFGWQREDLNFQANQQALQFGWQMEDIDEALRFATGRQRRQLLRRQERAAITFGMGQGRIETQRGRVDTRERWAREDLDRERRQFEERFRLQDDYQNQYRRYVEERRRLEDELQQIREFNARYQLDAANEQLTKQQELQAQLDAITEVISAINQQYTDANAKQQQIVSTITWLVSQFGNNGDLRQAMEGFITAGIAGFVKAKRAAVSISSGGGTHDR